MRYNFIFEKSIAPAGESVVFDFGFEFNSATVFSKNTLLVLVHYESYGGKRGDSSDAYSLGFFSVFLKNPKIKPQDNILMDSLWVSDAIEAEIEKTILEHASAPIPFSSLNWFDVD